MIDPGYEYNTEMFMKNGRDGGNVRSRNAMKKDRSCEIRKDMSVGGHLVEISSSYACVLPPVQLLR